MILLTKVASHAPRAKLPSTKVTLIVSEPRSKKPFRTRGLHFLSKSTDNTVETLILNS